jgi:hypothetical protein
VEGGRINATPPPGQIVKQWRLQLTTRRFEAFVLEEVKRKKNKK